MRSKNKLLTPKLWNRKIGRGAFLTDEAVPKGAVEGKEERMPE